MSGFLVPVGQGNIQVSEQMKRDAQAAMGSIDAGGRLPRLYLCQATGEIVKSGVAADKDWTVSAGDDNVVNLGKSPMFIVLSAQTRYRHAIHDDAEDKEKVLWDAPKGKLTRAQDDDVGAKRAKRYTLFVLLHVTETGLDPKRIGPISYAAKGMSTLAGMKWADAVAAMIYKGVPPFILAWKLGSKLEESVKGRGSWNVMTHDEPMRLNPDAETYQKLKDTWAAADAARRHDDGSAAPVEPTEPTDDELGDRADREAAGQGYAADQGGDYATSLPPEDEEVVKPAVVVPDEYAAPAPERRDPKPVGDILWYQTELLCGKDADGAPIRKAIASMTSLEADMAFKLAYPHVESNVRARNVCDALVVWREHKGWSRYSEEPRF